MFFLNFWGISGEPDIPWSNRDIRAFIGSRLDCCNTVTVSSLQHRRRQLLAVLSQKDQAIMTGWRRLEVIYSGWPCLTAGLFTRRGCTAQHRIQLMSPFTAYCHLRRTERTPLTPTISWQQASKSTCKAQLSTRGLTHRINMFQVISAWSTVHTTLFNSDDSDCCRFTAKKRQLIRYSTTGSASDWQSEGCGFDAC